MYNIALIGAGQLGSRHLQGLKKAPLDMHISVVDNNQESLRLARQRYDEVEKSGHVILIDYLQNINDLEDMLDLVIIATGSFPRAAIIKEILSRKQVKNIVLEKFLFPNIDDYDEIYQLLSYKYLLRNTWVNCPRRMYDSYIQFKKEIEQEKILKYVVEGGDWGLACNAIHFIDHMIWLTGDKNLVSIDVRMLDQTIWESRRSGYIELTGKISGISEKGTIFSISSLKDCSDPILISLYTKNDVYQIRESDGIVLKNGEIYSNVKMCYQSELTGLLVGDILLNNNCKLTVYEESANLHKLFLQAVISFCNKLTGKFEKSCPIT
jgi:predicted dehydrogenase